MAPNKLNKLNERDHWSRVQAAVIGRFNFWGKAKANPVYVARVASEIADIAVSEMRKRK